MEGTHPAPSQRLAAYRRARPEASICYVRTARSGGFWRAWIPDAPGSTSGTELEPCRRLGDLLDRLDELGGA